MALTAGEKQARYREKQRIAQKEAIDSGSAAKADYLVQPFPDFVKFMRERSTGLQENLDALGVQITGTWLDEEVQTFDSQYEREKPMTALERAMALAEVFTEASAELRGLVHDYKLAEIERAIERAITHGGTIPADDVAAKKANYAEVERLMAIRSELRKAVRVTFPSMIAKGEGQAK